MIIIAIILVIVLFMQGSRINNLESELSQSRQETQNQKQNVAFWRSSYINNTKETQKLTKQVKELKKQLKSIKEK